LHALAVDRLAVLPQHPGQPSRAQERPLREQLVEPPHQPEVVVVGRPRGPVHARPGDPQQIALPADRQIGMVAIEQRSPVRNAHLPDLRAKKSRSTTSSPILACRRSISRSRSGGGRPALERPCRLVLKLLLPGVDLVGMYLIALGQVGHRRLLAQRLQGDLRLQAASIFRLVFCAIVRSA
jgi:hypothetical protein